MTEIEGAVFWKDSNIIHCTITDEFDGQFREDDTARFFADRIRCLSNGRYLPLLIDLTEVGHLDTFRLFTIFSPPSSVVVSVLSISILVRSYPLRIALSGYCFLNGNAFWHTLYSEPRKAMENCQMKLKMGYITHRRLVGA